MAQDSKRWSDVPNMCVCVCVCVSVCPTCEATAALVLNDTANEVEMVENVEEWDSDSTNCEDVFDLESVFTSTVQPACECEFYKNFNFFYSTYLKTLIGLVILLKLVFLQPSTTFLPALTPLRKFHSPRLSRPQCCF